MSPVYAELIAERGTAMIYRVGFEGRDYSGATFTMEVRDFNGQTGTPRLSLTNAAAGAQGLSVSPQVVNGVTTSYVTIQINEVTIEGFPTPSPLPSDLVLYYALDIAGGGHIKQRRLKGPLIVKASANG